MNMNILIPVSAIQAARKLLTRVRFERLKLPVLSHVLATLDAAGLTMAVSDLDHWLETRIPASILTTQTTQTSVGVPKEPKSRPAKRQLGADRPAKRAKLSKT